MIKKYIIGDPIETDSVVVDIIKSEGALPYFAADEEAHTLTFEMSDDTRIYGLGEVLVFIGKGHSLPVADPAMRVEDIDYDTMHFLSYGDSDVYHFAGERDA